MHPAPSMIVFTVLTGLGLGMVALLGLGLGPDYGATRWIASALALLIGGVGGAASLGHLAHPERAWRGFSQWRSSWLSREAWLLAATLALYALYAAFWCLGDLRLRALGWLVAALALATVYATSKIYHQLRAVPRWSVPPTPALFLAFALAGGWMGVRTAQALVGEGGADGWLALALIAAGGVWVWWQTQAAGARLGAVGTDMGTATGLGRLGRIRLFEPPHLGHNYLLDEMAFRVGRRRAYQLRWLGAGLGLLLPLALVVLSWLLGGWLLLPALLSHVAGVLALRWLFFAEAEHTQALYYGRV